MVVSNISFDDLWELCELGREMHAESPAYSGFEYSREKVTNLAAGLIEDPRGIALKATEDGVMYGAMCGMVTEFFFSEDLYATDFMLYVSAEFRGGLTAARLVRAFERRAREAGALQVRPGITAGINPETSRSFYESLGYKLTGYSLTKDW